MFMEDEISGLDKLVSTPPQKQRNANPRYIADKQQLRTEPSRGSPPVQQRLKHSGGSARKQPSGPSRDSAVGQPQMRPPNNAPVQASVLCCASMPFECTSCEHELSSGAGGAASLGMEGCELRGSSSCP